MGISFNFGRGLRSRGMATPTTVAGKVGMSLCFLLCLVVGVLFFAFISGGLWKTFQTYQWPATPCRIVSSKAVNNVLGGANGYRFHVEYTYTHEGQNHRSTTFEQDYDGSDHSKAVRRLVEQYPAGSAATCYVNPEDADEAVLQRQSLWFGLILLLPLALVVVGGGGIVAVWGPGGRAGRSRVPGEQAVPTASASNRTHDRKWGVIPVMAFFSLFLVIGLGFTWLLLIHPLLRVWDARSWTAVPAIIESSSVQSHDDTDGTTYSLDILYRYKIDGKIHRSNRYHFIRGTSSGRAGKQRVVDRLPMGTKTTAYVNPGDPDEAVLDRGATWIVLVGLLPLLFVAVGLGGLIAAPKAASRQRLSGGTGGGLGGGTGGANTENPTSSRGEPLAV